MNFSVTEINIEGVADAEAAKSAESHIYSVSEINKAIRENLESKYAEIWLKGEISNFKPHTSGHFYFSLKDAKAQVSAVMFKGFNSKLRFRPADGLEVLVKGKITVYEPRGSYQVFCEFMEPVGAGALQLEFEQLKAKLQAEGLFAPERKRPLPALPQHVVLVTSPTGAAVRDMLNVLNRRFKGLKITVVPCLVQGEQAPKSIVGALQLACDIPDVDVIIVGRGGGSIEDLWAFNSEIVARAIASASVPVISAVGHEVDFTIADFVADLRAPTPSAAAELVVRNAAEILESLIVQGRRLVQDMKAKITQTQRHLAQVSARLVDPQRRLQDLMIRCDELSQRLESSALRYVEERRFHVKLLRSKMPSPEILIHDRRQALQLARVQLQAEMKRTLETKVHALGQAAAVLDSLSPLKVVERGYSITTKDEKVIKEAGVLQVDDPIRVRFARGEVEARVLKVYNDTTDKI